MLIVVSERRPPTTADRAPWVSIGLGTAAVVVPIAVLWLIEGEKLEQAVTSFPISACSSRPRSIAAGSAPGRRRGGCR